MEQEPEEGARRQEAGSGEIRRFDAEVIFAGEGTEVYRDASHHTVHMSKVRKWM